MEEEYILKSICVQVVVKKKKRYEILMQINKK